jgi:LysR family transcriptional regulator of abg operon
MTLQQLRDLMAVVQHGGFRAAARALNVAQAGLTKSVARLEEEHSIVLIDRTAKGIALSAQGEIFLAHAQAVLLESERAEDWLRRLKSQVTSVSLGVSIEPSLQLTPAVLADFRKRFPDVTIHMSQSSSSELLAAIRDNRIELAVTRIPESLEAHDLRIDLLYKSNAAIFARSGHPRRNATSIRELADLEWVIVGSPRRAGIDDESIKELFLEQQLGRPRLAAVCDSLFGAVSMLLESDCVARLPITLLEHPLTKNLLTEIRVDEQKNRYYNIAVISKASRRLSEEARVLVSMLRSFSRMRAALSAHPPGIETGRV